MSRAKRTEPDPSLLHSALLPLSLVVFFFLAYGAQLPLHYAALGLAPLLALFLVAPFWAKASVARYDRDALRLLATGRAARLDARFGSALGMRLFAPGALVAERRAMVCAELGRHAEAERAYRKAVAGYERPEDAPLKVRLGYAHACHAAADDAEAIRAYGEILEGFGVLPHVERNLAHARVRSGSALAEADATLERLERAAHGADEAAELKLLRAQAALRAGRRRDATRLREEAAEGGSPLCVALRAELDALDAGPSAAAGAAVGQGAPAAPGPPTPRGRRSGSGKRERARRTRR